MQRLRAAFARMLGDSADEPAPKADAVTPEGIIEAALFVGQPDGAPLSAEQLAAVTRDVTPNDVDDYIRTLEDAYETQEAPYRIERSDAGYRLVLREGLDRVADRIGGRVRTAKLSAQALETLSVVAYRQPIGCAEIDQLRGTASSSSVRTLVKRGLVRVDQAASGNEEKYGTTDRFLRLLDLASLEQLPRLAELDD